MKAISLVKSLTVVVLFVAGVPAVAADSCTNTLGVTLRTNCETKYKGQDDKVKECSSTLECLQSKKEDDDKLKADAKESAEECKSLLSAYDKDMEDTDVECKRMKLDDTTECLEKANSCGKGLDSFSENDESATASIVNMIGIYGQMQANAAGAPSSGNTNLPGCVIENSDKEKDKESTVDDKITRIREEISDLKAKATEADKDFNDKKNEVENQINDAQKDLDKAKFEKQTQNQKDAAQIQKAMLASDKKRKDNLVKMADIQVAMGDLNFQVQQINLDLSSDTVTARCRGETVKNLNAKTAGSVDPKTGKVTNPKYTLQQSAQIKKDLQIAEANCFQQTALAKQKVIKGIANDKRSKQVQIDQMLSENADEATAFDNDKKQMDSLKAISDQEEQKMMDNSFKKMNTLNQSVIDMQQHVVDKKKTYDEKIQAKNDQINKLLIERQNVTAKFTKVSSTVSKSKRAASNYINQCCSDKNKLDKGCKRVQSSETDITPEKVKKTSGSSK